MAADKRPLNFLEDRLVVYIPLFECFILKSLILPLRISYLSVRSSIKLMVALEGRLTFAAQQTSVTAAMEPPDIVINPFLNRRKGDS